MGRFFASEYLRDSKAQEFWIDKALDAAKPLLKEFGKKGMNQVFTAIRPKKDYLTNKKDLYGAGLLSDMVYGFNYAPWTNPTRKGNGVDIHKAIGKLPKPKRGWTLPGHRYTGPYNPLDQRLRYNPETGEILEIYQQPTGKTDAVAMQHDVDYSVCGNNKKCKSRADRKL